MLPETSRTNAMLTGRLRSLAKYSIRCRAPSSYSTKSSGPRFRTGRPFRSATTAGTMTRSTEAFSTKRPLRSSSISRSSLLFLEAPVFARCPSSSRGPWSPAAGVNPASRMQREMEETAEEKLRWGPRYLIIIFSLPSPTGPVYTYSGPSQEFATRLGGRGLPYSHNPLCASTLLPQVFFTSLPWASEGSAVPPGEEREGDACHVGGGPAARDQGAAKALPGFPPAGAAVRGAR